MQLDKSWKNDHVENVIERALDVKRIINQKANDKNTWKLDVSIAVKNEQDLNLLLNLQSETNVGVVDSELNEVLQVGRIELTRGNMEMNEDFVVNLKNMETTLCPRCRRFSVVCAESICNRCTSVLDGERAVKVRM